MNTWLRRVTRYIYRPVIYLVVIIFVIYAVRAVDSTRKPDLMPWHAAQFDQEFRAKSEANNDWQNYLELETRVFKELDAKVMQRVPENAHFSYNRYSKRSRTNPTQFQINWNRSFEMRPRSEPIGTAILVHGLTDSPYSVRATAEILLEEGFYVIGPRMPGHGTAPSGLLTASWKDWAAVVRLAVAHGIETVGPEKPLIVGGYSNGAALSLNYTLDAINDASLPVPDRLVLLSPAVVITPLAQVTSWHQLLSWMPYFEKFKWLDILPEYDPYKYNSFPKNAAFQNFTLTRKVQEKLDQLQSSGDMSLFPPVIAFQSIVDATVKTSALFDDLYERFEPGNSELVLFDINRSHELSAFIKESPDLLQSKFDDTAVLAYQLTGVSNITPHSKYMLARSRDAGGTITSTCELDLEWPREVFSLSHTAIPFRPDDPIYGNAPDSKAALSNISPRGERGVLRVSLSLFARLRHNPFFSYLDWRLRRFINQGRNVMPLCPINEGSDDLPASL